MSKIQRPAKLVLKSFLKQGLCIKGCVWLGGLHRDSRHKTHLGLIALLGISLLLRVALLRLVRLVWVALRRRVAAVALLLSGVRTLLRVPLRRVPLRRIVACSQAEEASTSRALTSQLYTHSRQNHASTQAQIADACTWRPGPASWTLSSVYSEGRGVRSGQPGTAPAPERAQGKVKLAGGAAPGWPAFWPSVG